MNKGLIVRCVAVLLDELIEIVHSFADGSFSSNGLVAPDNGQPRLLGIGHK